MNKIVCITGFGEFSGVKENPTTKLVQELEAQKFEVDGHITKFEVLEVSVEYCNKFLGSLDLDSNQYIFIHLGVDSNGTAIKLEQCAYNNMNFRVPDERGFQPQVTPIDSNCALDTPLLSALSLPSICEQINVTLAAAPAPGDLDVTLSTDPGRFLCNYIYYNSLQLQQANNRPRHAVFVHVPTFSTLPFENQLKSIQEIIKGVTVDK